jgi:hypothetical protein
MSDEGVGVAVPDAVFGLEERDEFHVFHISRVCQDGEPVVDGLAVGAFDRWEVRGRALDFRCI